MKSYYNRTFSMENYILDKICSNILPRIFHYVNELIIEQHVMEHVLHTFNHPKVYHLLILF